MLSKVNIEMITAKHYVFFFLTAFYWKSDSTEPLVNALGLGSGLIMVIGPLIYCTLVIILKEITKFRNKTYIKRLLKRINKYLNCKYVKSISVYLL